MMGWYKKAANCPLAIKRFLGQPTRVHKVYPWALDSDTGAHVPCPLPWTSAMVYPDGHIQACCFNGSNLGNINHQGLDDVWNGPGYRALRSALAVGDYDGAGCSDCPMYARSGWTTKQSADNQLTEADGTDEQKRNLVALRSSYDKKADRVTGLPMTLMLELSDACNYDCEFCFQTDKKLGVRGEAVSRLVQRILPTCRNLTLTGGEPLASKEVLDILKSTTPAQAATLNLEMYTNGALLERNWSVLSKFSNFHCVISLHSLDDGTYRRIMRATTGIKPVLDAIIKFRDFRLERPVAAWRMTLTNIVMTSTVLEAPALARFSIEYDCDVQFVHMHGDYDENIFIYPFLVDPDLVAAALDDATAILTGDPRYQRAINNLDFCRNKLLGPPAPTREQFDRWKAEGGRGNGYRLCSEMFAQRGLPSNT